MRNSTTGWLLLAPTLFILFITGLLPFLYVLAVSFFDWNTFAQNPATICRSEQFPDAGL